MLLEIVKGFIILAAIFIPIERIFALHNQKVFRRAWKTDVIYFFSGHFIGKATGAIILAIAFSHFPPIVNLKLQNTVASQPVLLQFLEAVIVADMGYYIAHRLLHELPWLWQFHAVHHSIEDMDWLAAVRVHPCDQVFTRIWQIIPLYWLGFSRETWAIYVLYSAAIAFLIHANIKVKFGILKWLIATPQFHHWHHSQVPLVPNKNFAAQFPLLDLLFGTMYMPAQKMPHKYGVSDSIPAGYVGQMFYPFSRMMKNAKSKFKTKY